METLRLSPSGLRSGAVARFVEAPSAASWQDLVLGLDPAVRGECADALVDVLLEAGADPETSFLAMTSEGLPPEAVALVERALVGGRVVLVRAALSMSPAEQLGWLVLARWLDDAGLARTWGCR